MLLRAVYDGGGAPFEGERELVLRRLPADARVLSARATVTPIDTSDGSDPFAEEIHFPAPNYTVGDWGATQVRGPEFAEVDFHIRRTLAGLSGSDLADANLQVDLGGSFVGVDPLGAFAPPAGPFLSLTNDGPVPGISASRVRIASTATGERPAVAAVRIRSLPAGVTLALAGQPALFFHPGELATPATTPDWGGLLAGYLAEGAEVADGVFVLPFVLHSDTIARLVVALEIEYLRTARLLPAGLPQAKLAFDLATVPRAGSAALSVALPAAAAPVAAASEGRVEGSFGETRIAWGPAGEVDAPGVVVLSPARSAAQPLALPERPAGYEIVAVDLLLAAADRRASLTLDLRHDEDRKPGADSLLAAPVPFELTRAASGGQTWLSVELPRPLALRSERDRKAWLLLQSAEGEATWSVAAADPAAVPLQVSADGGFSYRAATTPGSPAPLAALFRLREKPAGFRIPLAAELGSGGAAVRVDLSRLSPLGKVDFELSIPEIAAGISAALERARANGAGGPGGTGGELLADPRFARWAIEGDELEAPQAFFLEVAAQAAFVAFAPDGRTACVALAVAEAFHFIAWDTETGAVAWSFETDLAAPQGLAIDPAGRFAYALLGGRLAVVDLEARRLAGAPLAVDDKDVLPNPAAVAASSDGLRIAMAGRANTNGATRAPFAIYDAESFAGLARRRAGRGTAARTGLGSLLPAGAVPVAVAFSRDGACLYALTASFDPDGGAFGELAAYDTRVLAADPVRVSFDGIPVALAEAPDSRSVLVLHPNRLDLYDARTLALRAPSLPLVAPRAGFAALAVEPGGRRALLAGAGGLLAVALAPAGMRIVSAPPGVGPSVGIAVAPQGDRALAVSLSTTGLAARSTAAFLIPIGTPRPLDWARTAGRARPLTLTGATGRGTQLGEVSAGFSTQLAVGGQAPLGPSALSQVVPAAPGRTYELSFLGGATGEARAEVLWRSAAGGRLGAAALPIRVLTAGPSPLHRARLLAPARTVAAEVRFIVEDGAASVHSASFREPENALAHGDLRGSEAVGEGAWRQEPSPATGFLITGARLRNAGAAPVALRQEVAVEGGEPFELIARARLESGPPARVELRFLDATGAAVGSPPAIVIDARTFAPVAAAGGVPANAARAEVTLALPAGAALEMGEIDLRLRRPVEIPLTFLAEAPGELAVIGGTIAWDLPGAAAAPPRPAPGSPPLPAPTPPGGTECADEETGHQPPSPPAAPPPAPPPPPVRPTPIEPTAITGIGPRRAEILRANGIARLEALLAADPRHLARILPTVSERMAVGFIRQARQLLGQA